MKKLFAAISIMSMVLSSLPAFAGTDDDNNGPEIEPVYFGFTFDINSCSDENPCMETKEEESESSENSEDPEEQTTQN